MSAELETREVLYNIKILLELVTKRTRENADKIDELSDNMTTKFGELGVDINNEFNFINSIINDIKK